MIPRNCAFPPESVAAGPPRRARDRRAIFLLLLATVNLALFLPSMSGDFLWDDKYFISENPNIQGGGFLKGFLFSPFGGFSGTDENSKQQDRVMQFYRPLVSLSYRMDFELWGLNPAAFHLTNILIHTVNAIVFFLILIGLSLSAESAFLGAFLFSVYPLHFENVSWISGRTDLLAFLFAGLSALAFMRFFKSRTLPSLLGSAAAFFLALLCKESVILLPLVFFFFCYKKDGRFADSLFRLWPFGLAFAAWLALRLNALGLAPPGQAGGTLPDLPAAIGFYAWKMIFPFRLPLTVDALPVLKSAVFRALGGALVALCLFSAWQALRKSLSRGWPYWTFLAWLLFLLPSALVVLSPSVISLLAWRFLYLPSAVLLGAVAFLLGHRVRFKAVAIGAVVVLSAVYALEIYPKNEHFGKDEKEFWLGIKDPGREDALARFNIGVNNLFVDEKKALDLFDGILNRQDHPLYKMLRTRIYEELAIFYTVKKDFPKAESYFDDLLKSGGTQSLNFYFNYSYFLAFSGKRQEGEQLVLGLIRQFPRNHFVFLHAAKFYLIFQDYGRAGALYAEDFRLFRYRQSDVLARQAAALQQKAR